MRYLFNPYTVISEHTKNEAKADIYRTIKEKFESTREVYVNYIEQETSLNIFNSTNIFNLVKKCNI